MWLPHPTEQQNSKQTTQILNANKWLIDLLEELWKCSNVSENWVDAHYTYAEKAQPITQTHSWLGLQCRDANRRFLSALDYSGLAQWTWTGILNSGLNTGSTPHVCCGCGHIRTFSGHNYCFCCTGYNGIFGVVRTRSKFQIPNSLAPQKVVFPCSLVTWSKSFLVFSQSL